eukprot:1161048-Pelagomonas_calceolata.AAC.4
MGAAWYPSPEHVLWGAWLVTSKTRMGWRKYQVSAHMPSSGVSSHGTGQVAHFESSQLTCSVSVSAHMLSVKRQVPSGKWQASAHTSSVKSSIKCRVPSVKPSSVQRQVSAHMLGAPGRPRKAQMT